MKPDYYSLTKAGLNQEEIAKISVCEDQGMQIRMLRKYRYKLLDEIHGKQQSLDAIYRRSKPCSSFFGRHCD